MKSIRNLSGVSTRWIAVAAISLPLLVSVGCGGKKRDRRLFNDPAVQQYLATQNLNRSQFPRTVNQDNTNRFRGAFANSAYGPNGQYRQNGLQNRANRPFPQFQMGSKTCADGTVVQVQMVKSADGKYYAANDPCSGNDDGKSNGKTPVERRINAKDSDTGGGYRGADYSVVSDTTPLWQDLCESENVARKEDGLRPLSLKLNRSNDMDYDAIPDECEAFLWDAGYNAGRDRQNAWAVTFRSFVAKELKDNLSKKADQLTRADHQKLKEEIKNNMEKGNGLLGWKKLFREEKSVLNTAIASYVVLDRLLNNDSSDEIVRQMLKASDENTHFTLRPAVGERDAFPDGVTTLRGGSGTQAIFMDPRMKDPPFRLADMNGIKINYKALAEKDAFIYVAEAWIRSPHDMTMRIGNLPSHAGRPAGIFIAFVDGSIVAHTIDMKNIPKEMKKVLSEIKSLKISTVTSRQTHHVVIAMVVQNELNKKDAEKLIAENVLVRFGNNQGNTYELMPQVFATFRPPPGDEYDADDGDEGRVIKDIQPWTNPQDPIDPATLDRPAQQGSKNSQQDETAAAAKAAGAKVDHGDDDSAEKKTP